LAILFPNFPNFPIFLVFLGGGRQGAENAKACPREYGKPVPPLGDLLTLAVKLFLIIPFMIHFITRKRIFRLCEFCDFGLFGLFGDFCVFCDFCDFGVIGTDRIKTMKTLKADLVIFDLDGTLIDSKRDIAYAVNQTLARIDHPPIENELIYQYVGSGVRPLIEKAVATTGGGNSLEEAIRIFYGLYMKHLLDTTVMFDGIPEVLEHFKGKKMAVATNKSIGFTLKILDGLGILEKFVSVKGADSQKEKKPHPMMVEDIMKEAGIGKAQTVIVGDSAVDIQTGKNANIQTLGVTYGFRPTPEIHDCLPDAIAATPADIIKIIR
jgi:phosphoglycolate phosphatase